MLLIAFTAKWTGAPPYCFIILFGIAISLKSIFLILVFREKGFKPSLWLYLILAGVALMLLSILFKNTFQMPVLNKILFYGAIMLKMSGLVLMLFSKRKTK
jgi:hypothetical protein